MSVNDADASDPKCADEGTKRRSPPDVCCEAMSLHLLQTCEQHADPFDCPDNVIYWSPTFDEFGLIIHDGGSSYILVEHCPWCGKTMPTSKRDQPPSS